jgi:hypothetical protein
VKERRLDIEVLDIPVEDGSHVHEHVEGLTVREGELAVAEVL